MNLEEKLHAGIADLGISIPGAGEEKLLAYLALLTKWNRTYNLTAVRNEDEMVTHHLLDSLSVLPILESRLSAEKSTLADVGSGAGLPGLLLAISRPDWQIASVEASQKKAAFQQQVKIELGLSNVSIHCARVESIEAVFSAVISRAFASLSDFVRSAGHLSNRLFAMKGRYPDGEVAALPTGWRLSESQKLLVPDLNAERHVLILERS